VLLTLNQVISQITTLAAAHNQIAASGVGDFAEWQGEERNYPLLWVFHETTSVGNRELVFSIRLICADRVIVGEEGEDTDGMEQEVLSDTMLILLDFLSYFMQQHSQSYTVVPSATIDPFTERLNDRLAGNSVIIQIRQPFTWDACQIPQTGATIPPTVDGLTLYDFCDPSVIARLTAAQVVCLEAEYGLTCADGNIELNGVQVATVASGGTEDIPVLSEGSNPVGSLVGSDWVIENNATTINGVQVTDQEAEQDAAIFVTRDGVQNGSWNAGTQTWEVTSAPCSPVTFQINAVNKESIASGVTFNLITKLDGAVNSGSYDAPTDTLSFTSAIPTPKTTAFLLKTGETVNYGAGSDGQVQSGRGTSWLVMAENNMFGNTNRFTDTLGGQTYANNIVLDHQSRSPLTGQLLGYDKADVVTARTWAAMLTYANTKTVAGYPGWRLTNDLELQNIRRQGTNYSWGYAPFNWSGGTMDYSWTSTTYHLAPANAYLWFNTSTVAQQARDKTGSYFGMFCRTFTLTDGGVLS
jgi:hypothetical protein